MALVAQMPESAHVAWSVQPAPQIATGSGSQASIVVLESTWHLALGRNVTADAHLEAASEEFQLAALIPLKQVGEPPDTREIPLWSFLERRPPTRVSLLDNINPQRGRQTRISGLLVVHPGAPASQPQVVFVTVTAL